MGTFCEHFPGRYSIIAFIMDCISCNFSYKNLVESLIDLWDGKIDSHNAFPLFFVLNF